MLGEPPCGLRLCNFLSGALAGLVLLGMRQQPGLDTLLEAARHVQRQAQEADAAAGQAQGQDEQRKAQELCDMAQARGKVRGILV